MPEEGDAATTSWLRWRRLFTISPDEAGTSDDHDFHFLIQTFSLSAF